MMGEESGRTAAREGGEKRAEVSEVEERERGGKRNEPAEATKAEESRARTVEAWKEGMLSLKEDDGWRVRRARRLSFEGKRRKQAQGRCEIRPWPGRAIFFIDARRHLPIPPPKHRWLHSSKREAVCVWRNRKAVLHPYYAEERARGERERRGRRGGRVKRASLLNRGIYNQAESRI